MPPLSRRSLIAALAPSVALPLVAPSAWAAKADDDEERGIPNLFISPCGEPFRAAAGAPYPVVEWFHGADKDGDGKLERAEFVDDADRFFKKLDLNGDGALNRFEISVYERTMVPEILGGSVSVGHNDLAPARLWLAQYMPGGGAGQYAPPNVPSGDTSDNTLPTPKKLDESGVGASPYGFFDEPEPILTADLNVNGLILRDNFLKVANMHFDALDPNGRGFLTLKGLPETLVEKLIAKSRHGRPF